MVIAGAVLEHICTGGDLGAIAGPMHTLYDFRFSGNGWKVRWMLRALGIAHRWVEVDILAGATRSAWFLDKNPVGEIPVLELPDGRCLAESHAILLTLAQGTPWVPDAPLERAEVLRWLCFEQTHVDGVISRARFRRCYPGVVPTTAADLARWDTQGRRTLALVEAHLTERAYLVAERPTLADVAISAYLQVAEQGGFSLEPLPHLRAWLARVALLPEHLPIDAVPEPSWFPAVGTPATERPIRRGELYWLTMPQAPGHVATRHPHVVLQDDVLNASRLDRVVVCALTSNLGRAREAGNVCLEQGEGGLPQRSVVVVSQLESVPKHRLTERIGALSDARVDEVMAGLRFQQRSTQR